MSRIGFHASHEQFSPQDLLGCAHAAQQAGFAALSCSDHFHPWSEQQGHSGHSWSWLGAALASTTLSAGVVTCPFGRQHPAVVAQACATLAAIFPGRFWVAVGSGEALNEHITGEPWPDKPRRRQMLLESVAVMRALWRGEWVSHDGAVRVDRARLYSLPEQAPPLFAAALTTETARWAGGWADGLITVAGPRDETRALIDAFHDGAGSARPVYLQAKIAYVPPPGGEAAARAMAHEQWRTNVFDSTTAAELALPADYEARAAQVRPEDMDRAVRISDDLERHADWLAQDLDLGVERIFLHNVGTNQREVLAAFGEHVLPRFAAAGHPSSR
jgi:coenzyme F420-dependent glucose-6-phosphate dehydrogenase